MNKKPVLFRFIFAVIVVAIFGLSINPPTPRDFFKTFEEMIPKDKDDTKIQNVIKLAKEKVKEDKVYESVALDEVAKLEGVELNDYVTGRDLTTNKDVISLIRKNASGSIRLGIDLNGGAEFLLKLIPDESLEKEEGKTDKDASRNFNEYRDVAIEILRNRLESQNIFEAEILPAGGEFISMRVPIVTQDEKKKLIDLIKMSARLEFRLVADNSAEQVEKYKKDPKEYLAPIGYEMMSSIEKDRDTQKFSKKYYLIKIKPEMTGKNVVDAQAAMGDFGQRQIHLRFNTAGAKRFADVTEANVGKQLAIVLDDKLYSAPVIKDAITGGNAVISGDFSREEAINIANALVSGSIPVKINIEAVFDTDPTLGKEAVKNGLSAGIMGLIVVMLFMALYYLRAGIIADIALAVNLVLVLGSLAAFEATLTLPGIAGIILTIGMAVDANVLIFERIREELNNHKTLSNAIENGYNRAFTTILDANLTTLFTALILMLLGTGAIKGFAVTLSIGIITSMFTALFLTRLIFDMLGRLSMFSSKMKMWNIFNAPNIDFLGLRKITAVISGLLIIASLTTFVILGKGMLGVDFTGGTQLSMSYERTMDIAKINNVLKADGYTDFKTAFKTSFAAQDNKVLEVVLPPRSEKNLDANAMSNIVTLLNKSFPDNHFTAGNQATLGGLIGEQFAKTAILAMFFAIIGIIIYISIRFEFTYAIASIIALIHDVIIATGIFVIFGNELSLPVIAALLTIIGYSLNDTIVVFDRIREDLELMKDKTYKQIINISINQTLSRTILTSVTTLLVLIVLYLFGGVAIQNFIFVLLVGVVVGTYSSIFVASPIVAFWNKKLGSRVKKETDTPVLENTQTPAADNA